MPFYVSLPICSLTLCLCFLGGSNFIFHFLFKRFVCLKWQIFYVFDIILKRQGISYDIPQLNIFTTLFANRFDDIFLTSSFFLVPGKHTTVKMVNFKLTFIVPWRNIDEYLLATLKSHFIKSAYDIISDVWHSINAWHHVRGHFDSTSFHICVYLTWWFNNNLFRSPK